MEKENYSDSSTDSFLAQTKLQFDIPELNKILIGSGMIYVEVYPMKQEELGARLTEHMEEPDYYDVCVRPDDWPSNNHDVYAEWEYLAQEEAEHLIDLLLDKYPDLDVIWL